MDWTKIASDILKQGTKPRRRTGPSRPRGPRKPWWWGVVALVIAGGSYVYKAYIQPPRGTTTETRTESRPAPPSATGEAELDRLVREKRSDVPIQISGSVVRTLTDDLDGDRHQKFILEISPGKTVLVAHNIDVAPRAPVTAGDRVSLKGEYVWNEQGGLIHWTHHDPRGTHPGGWVEVKGKKYQ